MSKKLNKIALGMLIAALSLGTVALAARTGLAEENSAESVKNTTTSLRAALNGSEDNLQDETVYVFLNADGSVRKTVSSDWTKNDLGDDVYTKTEGKVSTPVSLKATYWLDGKEISPEKLKNSSGHVKIRYSFTNNEREGGYYVPYVVLSGLMLDNDHFKNIEVKNAKAVNDGTRTTVAAVALPGLQADLGTSAIDLPESFEVEADVTDFELSMTVSYATAKLFAEIETDSLDSVEALSAQLTKLQDAMNQLMDGSNQLRSGLSELASKTDTLVTGISTLKAGSTKLLAGVKSLDSGVSELLSGAKTLDSGAASALSGATQIKSGVATLVEKIDTLATNMAALDEQSESLISGASQLFDATLASVQDSLSTATADNYKTVITGAVENLTALATAAYASGDTTAYAAYVEQITELKTALAVLQVSAGAKTYASYYTQIASAASALPTALSPLTTGTESLESGLSSLKDGTSTLVSGLTTLKSGSSELLSGATALDNGLGTLNDSMPTLKAGVSQLSSGSTTLSDGLSAFNEEGVQKLVSAYEGNVSDLISRVKTIVNLSKNANQKVKYIYRVDEIK